MAADDPYGAPDDPAGLVAGGTDARPMRTGERVRSIAEPVFASDRSVGDVGRIVESQETSSLVRWADGSETWAPRASLEPTRMGAQATGTATDGASLTPSPAAPIPVAATPASSGLRTLSRVLIPIIVLAPALARLLRNSTSAGILLLLVVLTGLVALVWIVPRRRKALRGAASDADTTGTLDGE